MMQAICLESANPPRLSLRQMPRPVPLAGEVLVRVHSAGVIPTELLWYPTLHTQTGQPRKEAIPCHEFSGVIEAAGEGVHDLKTGQEVYGMNDWFSEGAAAEFCAAPTSSIALKPSRLSHIEAATVPISALTAWQGLFDRAKLQAGERVLVHGGAGGVGMFAVQLARIHGARVIATVSQRNAEFVERLGAEQVIDYRTQRFEELVRDVDVVFDTVGGDTLDRSWGVLKPQGRLVTIVSGYETSTEPKVKDAFFIVEPSRKQLEEVTSLFDSGRLETAVDAVVPLSEAEAAFSPGLKRHGRGKVVIDVTAGTTVNSN